jgi:hypothetical protein
MNQPKLPPNGFENGVTYRFRTLINNAISMAGVPAGSEFTSTRDGGMPRRWQVSFVDRNLPTAMTCNPPASWVASGHIEWLPDLYGNEEDE